VTKDLSVWLAVGALGLLCLVLLASLAFTKRAWTRELRGAHAQLGDLRARIDELESPVRRPDRSPRTEYVITGLGIEPTELDQGPAATVGGAVFADTVLRETVVKAASLAQGERRGLAPGTRNRIRFEMKQELRRSRKQRKADLKAAQRDLHARQREALAEEAS
jgi:hypothetical protein